MPHSYFCFLRLESLMSVMVTVKTEMTNAVIAEAACRRRFKSVSTSGDRITVQLRLPSRSWDVSVTLETKGDKIELRCDSDYRQAALQVLDEAYRAEEIIAAAESEGKSWEEYRNEAQELVLEVEG